MTTTTLKLGRILGCAIVQKPTALSFNPDAADNHSVQNYEANNAITWFATREALMAHLDDHYAGSVLVEHHDGDYEMWDIVRITGGAQ